MSSPDFDAGLNEAIAHYRSGTSMKPSSGATRGWLVHQTPERLYDATIFDVDCSDWAHLAGFRVGVTLDIVIAHESAGNFNGTWKIYAGRFMAKFPELRGERVPVVLTRASFANRKGAMDFVVRLRALCRFAASTRYPAGDDEPKPVTEC